MSFEQNAENVLSIDESRIELLCESGCVTLHERDWNINRQNQVINIICRDFLLVTILRVAPHNCSLYKLYYVFCLRCTADVSSLKHFFNI